MDGGAGSERGSFAALGGAYLRCRGERSSNENKITQPRVSEQTLRGRQWAGGDERARLSWRAWPFRFYRSSSSAELHLTKLLAQHRVHLRHDPSSDAMYTEIWRPSIQVELVSDAGMKADVRSIGSRNLWQIRGRIGKTLLLNHQRNKCVDRKDCICAGNFAGLCIAGAVRSSGFDSRPGHFHCQNRIKSNVFLKGSDWCICGLAPFWRTLDTTAVFGSRMI